MPTTWASPLHIFSVLGEAPSPPPPSTLIQTGQERPFLKMAAEAAFFNVPQTLMKRLLADEFAVAPRTDTTEAELGFEAIQTALRCSDEEACQCLEGIVETANAGECESLLGMDVVQECLETSDRSEVNQFLHAQHTKDDALKSIKEVLQAARQRLQAKRRKTGTASTGRLRKPVAFPSDVVWTECRHEVRACARAHPQGRRRRVLACQLRVQVGPCPLVGQARM